MPSLAPATEKRIVAQARLVEPGDYRAVSEIAHGFGVEPRTVRAVALRAGITLPTMAASRPVRLCAGCGKPTSGPASKRCRRCSKAARTASHQRLIVSAIQETAARRRAAGGRTT